MTVKGHVEGGTIVLDQPLDLPDGTEVLVQAANPLQDIHPEVLKYLGCLKGVLEDADTGYHEYLLRKHS